MINGKNNELLKTWIILDLLKVTEEHFRKNNIDSPRLNAELLLCSILNTKRINLYLDFEKPLSEAELAEYREKVRRRLTGEPLQYILGETEFYGLKFKVTPDVLIPRPETELLVEKTLAAVHDERLENPAILEIGSGSGCISIAIPSKIMCEITAIDISSKAIAIAEENSMLNNTSSRVVFRNINFLTDMDSFNGYNIIVSNPPYIAEDEMASLQKEVKDFEPREALTDNSDGLTFYRKILKLALSSKTGTNILLEIGDGKKEKIEHLVKEAGIKDFIFHKDLLGIDRVLQIKT